MDSSDFTQDMQSIIASAGSETSLKSSPEHTPRRMTYLSPPHAPMRGGWEVVFNTDTNTWRQVAGDTSVTDSTVRNLMASFNHTASSEFSGDELPKPKFPLPDTCPPFTHHFDIVDEDNIREVVSDRKGRVVLNIPYGKLDTDPQSAFDIQEKKTDNIPESNENYCDGAYLQDKDGNDLTLTGQRVRRYWSEEACRVINRLCGRRAWELFNKKELPPYVHFNEDECFSAPSFRQKTIDTRHEILCGNTGDMCITDIQSAKNSTGSYHVMGTTYILLPLGLTPTERRQAHEMGFNTWLKTATTSITSTYQLPASISTSLFPDITQTRPWYEIVDSRVGVSNEELFKRVMQLPWPYQDTSELYAWGNLLVPEEAVKQQDGMGVLRKYLEGQMKAYTDWSGINLPPLTDETIMWTGTVHDVETERFPYTVDYDPSSGGTGEVLGGFQLPPGIPLADRHMLWQAVKTGMLPWRKTEDGIHKTLTGQIVSEGTSLFQQYSLWCDERRLRETMFYSPPQEQCEPKVRTT